MVTSTFLTSARSLLLQRVRPWARSSRSLCPSYIGTNHARHLERDWFTPLDAARPTKTSHGSHSALVEFMPDAAPPPTLASYETLLVAIENSTAPTLIRTGFSISCWMRASRRRYSVSTGDVGSKYLTSRTSLPISL